MKLQTLDVYGFSKFWYSTLYIAKFSPLMLHLSSLNTSVYTLKDHSAAMLLHGTLKHASAMTDSFGNCCAAANQKSAAWGVALRSPALDRYVRSSVFACMSSSNHGMFSQINSWVTFSMFNLATSNAWLAKIAARYKISRPVRNFVKFAIAAIVAKNLQL